MPFNVIIVAANYLLKKAEKSTNSRDKVIESTCPKEPHPAYCLSKTAKKSKVSKKESGSTIPKIVYKQVEQLEVRDASTNVNLNKQPR